MKEKIGFIGLGVMGHSMASHILDAGYPLYVYNRTKSKADGLIAKGAIWCDSPAETARQSDIIFTIVGFPKDVEEVYLGEKGIVSALSEGKCAVDMTTTRPSLMLEIEKACMEKGASFADAPVSGGDRGAREATLTFMTGCSDETFQRIRPLLSVMGKSINHCGPVSSGQQTKMCNQIVIAGTMIGVSEALVYGAQTGLCLEDMVRTISGGAAGCWTLDNLAPRVIRGDYEPGFMIDHFVKDMGLALEESEKMGLCLPGLALVKQLYIALQAQGMGRNGTQALVKALEAVTGRNILKQEEENA